MVKFKLDPLQFMLEMRLGSVNTELEGSVVEWSVDYNNRMAAADLETFIGKYYNYSKVELPGEVYFTLGLPL